NRLGTTCTPPPHPVGSLLHRARSASRSKPLPRAVGGSRRFTGKVDKSATGSVNFFGPNRLARIAPDALPPPSRFRPRRHLVRLGPLLRALRVDRRSGGRLRQRRLLHH